MSAPRPKFSYSVDIVDEDLYRNARVLPSYQQTIRGEGPVLKPGPPPAFSFLNTRASVWGWRLTFVVGACVYGSHAVFINLCEVDGQIPFSTSSVVLMTELTKLVVCGFFFALYSISSGKKIQMPLVQQVWPFALPAVLYALNNNLSYFIQLHMDPASFQILGNLKIATTALLYRTFLRKPLSRIKWFALFLLTLAGVFNSLGGYIIPQPSGPNGSYFDGQLNAGQMHVSLVGLVLIVCYCSISGMAGVFSEYILKKSKQLPLSLQNILLYTFGVGLNGGSYFVESLVTEHDNAGTVEMNSRHLFTGFTFLTWVMIGTQAMSGLIMSVIFKHSNNIARLFLVSSSMMISTSVSMILFGLRINGFFCLAFLLVVVALYLHHR